MSLWNPAAAAMAAERRAPAAPNRRHPAPRALLATPTTLSVIKRFTVRNVIYTTYTIYLQLTIYACIHIIDAQQKERKALSGGVRAQSPTLEQCLQN